MPIPTDYAPPAAAAFPLIPADVYRVQIEDVDLEIKPNTFKKSPDDGQPEEKHQYKFKLSFLDPTLSDRKISFWTSTAYRANASKKGLGLYELLPVLLPAADMPTADKVTPEFINTLIGLKMRVTISHKENPNTKEKRANVSSFLADKE